MPQQKFHGVEIVVYLFFYKTILFCCLDRFVSYAIGLRPKPPSATNSDAVKKASDSTNNMYLAISSVEALREIANLSTGTNATRNRMIR